jgi:hypothetical protein
MTDKVWSIPAAAAQLSVGRSKMFDLIRRGEVETFRWNGRQYIRDDVLRAFIARISGVAA